MYRTFGKRLFDIVVAGIALMIALPAMMVVAVVVRTALGRPMLFRQVRPGRYGRPFTILKFRTMKHASAECDDDAPRMTRVGAFLRSTSLDELPELINVLRGEMSLVGPRPLLMEYLARYSAEQGRRHETRPGITGWAQVNGRNALNWDEKLRLDVWYVDHYSFAVDVKILAVTAIKIFNREGITEAGHVTVKRFTGSAQC